MRHRQSTAEEVRAVSISNAARGENPHEGAALAAALPMEWSVGWMCAAVAASMGISIPRPIQRKATSNTMTFAINR